MDYTDARPITGIYFNERDIKLPIPCKKPVDGSIECGSTNYVMDPNKRNLALIINNEKFDKSTGLLDREGSDKDQSVMKRVLDSLHFNIITRKNLSEKRTIQIFEDIASMDHRNNNCFVCVILSHGEEDNQIWCTNNKVKLDSLVEMLLPDRCSSLKGKPKLFFIQACRGLKYDSGALLHDAEVSQWSKYENIKSYNIPQWADVLIAQSTVPGFYSWRNATTGSWFIQSLAKVLRKDGSQHELQRLMISVNRMVAHEYQSNNVDMYGMKQIPYIANMLTKELYFYK